MTKIINKTMDRADLLGPEAQPVVKKINELIRAIYAKGESMTSWYGTLRRPSETGFRGLLRRWLRPGGTMVGRQNRGPDYQPLPEAADDDRIPWYLYWEIYSVLTNGPTITPGMRMLDAGGTASLFTCYLASLGCEVHSVDINPELVAHGNHLAKSLGWKAFSYAMDMRKLEFEDEYFDHAYSICVFEHLDFDIKQSALVEIARSLKPGGVLSITFDYRNPAPCVAAHGPDTRERNRLMTEEDIRRNFLSTPHFELLGNTRFCDNGKSYLVHPEHGNAPYTFGSIFLKKKESIRA